MEIPSLLPPVILLIGASLGVCLKPTFFLQVTNINVEAEVRNGLNQIEVCIRIPVNVI